MLRHERLEARLALRERFVRATRRRNRTELWLLLVVFALFAGYAGAQNASDAVAVDTLVAQANQRIKAGESPELVDAWLAKAMQQQGVRVREAPPKWDAYAQAQWRQTELAAPVAQDPRKSQAAPLDVSVTTLTSQKKGGAQSVLDATAASNGTAVAGRQQ